MKNNITIEDIKYRCSKYLSNTYIANSIDVIGIDTEAYDNGQCFIIATSNWHFWSMEEFPQCLFSREYRGANFVTYNLKYDEGALIQFLPRENLEELRSEGRTDYEGYTVSLIPHKCLTIRKGKNTATFYDMYNFYMGSLNYNAKKYLGKEKIEIETKSFSKEYVNANYCKIALYCIQDAILVCKLGRLLIKKFENFEIYPRKLYSTAYISYQYFRTKCNYPTVKKLWDSDKKLLDFAMKSYNGGKFEVVEKGCDYYYEYDIVSAYPFEIANLVDITHSRIVWSKEYRRYAIYGFIHVKIKIPASTYSPVAVVSGNVNIYPIGYIEKIITKNEYDYLIQNGADITIIEAVWIHIDNKTYPFRKEIEKLTNLKHQYKEEKNELDYHTVKILMNSLYGKFCQLIEKKGFYHASACWNPIYASVITANTRIKVTSLQQEHPEIIAVHTDSVISTKPLEFGERGQLGDMIFELEGEGVVIGSGLYQIGNKIKTRGFHIENDLMTKIDTNKKSIIIEDIRPHTWREVIFHNWEIDRINRFEIEEKHISVDFDKKRLWLDDYANFGEVKKRKVYSLPRVSTRFGV